MKRDWISSGDWSLVSGRMKIPKKIPRKETTPKNQNAPAVVIVSCMLTNVLVTINAVVQLTDEAIEHPGALNFGGRISAVISHGKGPTPKEKAAT